MSVEPKNGRAAARIKRGVWWTVGIGVALWGLAGACETKIGTGRTEAGRTAPSPDPRPSPPPVVEPPVDPANAADSAATRFADAPRIVAIGDVHGDLAATRAALRLAGAIGQDSDDWTGGTLVVVQTGDQLDRGDDEREILDLFESLRTQAAAAGGAVHVLNGNHEFMNVAGDLRYVTERGLSAFDGVPGLNVSDPRLAVVSPLARSRMAAFMPGGPYAKVLAQRNTAVIVGRTVFVHGGVLPNHVAGGLTDLQRINSEARAWLAGTSDDAEGIAARIMAEDSLVWTRVYAQESPQVCETLRQALTLLDADRMVVGHTVQSGGITSACADRLWRIDVGMARHYGGTPQVLLLQGDEVTRLGG